MRQPTVRTFSQSNVTPFSAIYGPVVLPPDPPKGALIFENPCQNHTGIGGPISTCSPHAIRASRDFIPRVTAYSYIQEPYTYTDAPCAYARASEAGDVSWDSTEGTAGALCAAGVRRGEVPLSC